jgi:hypothetical protein
VSIILLAVACSGCHGPLFHGVGKGGPAVTKRQPPVVRYVTRVVYVPGPPIGAPPPGATVFSAAAHVRIEQPVPAVTVPTVRFYPSAVPVRRAAPVGEPASPSGAAQVSGSGVGSSQAEELGLLRQLLVSVDGLRQQARSLPAETDRLGEPVSEALPPISLPLRSSSPPVTYVRPAFPAIPVMAPRPYILHAPAGMRFGRPW